MEKNKKVKIVKKSNKRNSTVKDTLLNDKSYKLAEKYFKNKEYDNAYQEYLKLSEVYLKNKKIYKRLIESLTHNYTYKEKSKAFKVSLDDYITTYKILATKRELGLFEKKLSEYKNVKASNNKSKFLLILFLGFLGVHKFIEKKYIMGIIYLFTLGLFGMGIIYDLINDYAEYENDFQLNIFRYFISILILVFALFRMDNGNYYYFIIVAIILTPLFFNKILKLIPNLIKIVAVVVLCYLGFKVEPVRVYVPNDIIGEWFTDNENTNYNSIIIKNDESTIKFNDRSDVVGTNQYDSVNKVLKIYVNETNYYKFRIDLDNDTLCTYNDSKTCIIAFKKDIEAK